MESPSFLAHLRAEFDAYEACLSGDLTAPVEHCGDWTLRDLTEHLGRSSLWATVAIEERRGDYSAPAAPRDPGELVKWFRDIRSRLLRALDQDPSVPAWTFRPPHRRPRRRPGRAGRSAGALNSGGGLSCRTLRGNLWPRRLPPPIARGRSGCS